MLLQAQDLLLPQLEVKKPDLLTASATKAIGNQYTFDHSTMLNQGAITVLQFLQMQGIVQLTKQSGISDQTNISIHGFGDNGSQNSLILIDSIPYTSSDVVSADINILLPENIQTMDILPGSYGALYGNQAVGGVVNITTQSPQKPQGDLVLGWGNHDQRLARLWFGGQLSDRFAANFGLSTLHNDNDMANDKLDYYNANAKFTYTGEHSNVVLGMLGYRSNSQIPNSQIYGQNSTPTDSDNYIDTTGSLVYLVANDFLTPTLKWHTALSNRVNDADGILYADFVTNQREWLWQNQLKWGSDWLAGIDLDYQDYQDYENHELSDAVTIKGGSVYTVKTFMLPDAFNFTIGGRYAWQKVAADLGSDGDLNTMDDASVFTTALNWQPNSKIKWYIRRSGNYRLPNAQEKVWVTDNVTELKAQTGVSYEMGLKWVGRCNFLQADIYRLDLDNEIEFDPGDTSSSAPYGKMSNLPPTRRIGLDLMDNLLLTQGLLISWQNTLVDPKIVSGEYNGNQVPDVSRYVSTINIHYHNARGWLISPSESYHSSYYAAEDLANTGSKLPGYFLTNLYLAKSWHQTTLGIQLLNLFNKHYPTYAYMPAGSSDIHYYPANGFTVLATLTMKIT